MTFQLFSFPGFTAALSATCTLSASASLPSVRAWNACAPWTRREAGRLFWWMLKSTAFGVSFTSATRFLRSEAFFSRSVLAPSE